MKRPDVIQGEDVCGRKEVHYRTHCQYCEDLAACKKRRAPVVECETPALVRFVVGAKVLVYWSGVIDLKKIRRIVRDYLEREPPADVAMPPQQMRMEWT